MPGERPGLAIDLHQHLWPEVLIRALERRSDPPRVHGGSLELTHEPGGRVSYEAHALESRLALLDRHGIEAAIVSLPPTLEADAHEELREAYHSGISEIVAASGGRLLALAAGERRAGFAGACLSAAALVAGADDVLTELDQAGELLFVHPGPPGRLPAGAPSWWPAVAEYTAQMQAAYLTWLHRDARRFPHLPVVFAMLAGGAPVQLERLRSRGVEERAAVHRNVFFETSSYGRRALELCLSTFGVGQLVFGSDAPVLDPGPTLASVRGFGDAVERIVLRENGERVLSLYG